MDLKMIFVFFWILAASFVVIKLYITGKKAVSIFPKIENEQIRFRDKNASGYSLKSWRTKIGGSKNTIDIIVFKDELWIKGATFFAGILEKHDLIHKVNISLIQDIEINGNNITLSFKTVSDEEKKVVIITKKRDEFINALGIYKAK